MRQLGFYVEGVTEANYVNRVLRGHLEQFDVSCWTIQAGTRRHHGNVSREGGRHYLPARNVSPLQGGV